MARGTFVHASDLEKIKDTLVQNERYHVHRDEMNAATRREPARHSPITSETITMRQRVDDLLDKADDQAGP